MNEIEFACGSCQQQLQAPSDLAGQPFDCPVCGQSVEVPYPDRTIKEQQVGNPSPLTLHKLTPQPSTESRRLKEYKVLTQKDKWFAGKFDPEKLEQAINAYASQGWQVVSVATASIPGLRENREEMVIVMVRDK